MQAAAQAGGGWSATAVQLSRASVNGQTAMNPWQPESSSTTSLPQTWSTHVAWVRVPWQSVALLASAQVAGLEKLAGQSAGTSQHGQVPASGARQVPSRQAWPAGQSRVAAQAR